MAKYLVRIDKDLRDFVPQYLESRREDFPRLFALHAASDLQALAKEGHKLVGAGGGYGFDRVTELGRQLETLALAGDLAGSLAALENLKEYLSQVEIIFE